MRVRQDKAIWRQLCLRVGAVRAGQGPQEAWARFSYTISKARSMGPGLSHLWSVPTYLQIEDTVKVGRF